MLAIATTTSGVDSGAPASLAGMPTAFVSALPEAGSLFAFLATTEQRVGDTFWPELPGGTLSIR